MRILCTYLAHMAKIKEGRMRDLITGARKHSLSERVTLSPAFAQRFLTSPDRRRHLLPFLVLGLGRPASNTREQQRTNSLTSTLFCVIFTLLLPALACR